MAVLAPAARCVRAPDRPHATVDRTARTSVFVAYQSVGCIGAMPPLDATRPRLHGCGVQVIL